MNRRKVVIAGNYRQFMEWCKATGTPPHRAIYADTTEKIMGLELAEEDIIYTGEHWLSKVDREVLRSRVRLERTTKDA